MTKDFPLGWVKASVGELAHRVRGVTFKKSESSSLNTDGLVPIVRAGNVSEGRLRLDEDLVYVPEERVAEEQFLRRGDIVVATSSGSASVVGKSALVGEDWRGAHGAFMAVLRPFGNVAPAFLAYCLQEDSVRSRWREAAAGTNINNLKRDDLLFTEIPLCPISEQCRIVAAIEEHFSRLDAADSALETARSRSAHLLECAIQAAIRQCSTEEFSLASFLTQKLCNGRSVPTANGDGFPVLRLTCLQGGLVNTNETKLGDFGGVDHEKYRIEPDDFLISRGNGSIRLVGIGGLVPANVTPVAFPDTLIRARVDHRRLRPEFLRLIWNSKIVRRQLEAQARTTAGIYKVNQTMIGKASFPTPSPEDQDRLVQELDQVRAVVAALNAGVSLVQERSKSLRRSILADAFSGQLVPQDPDDEPASVLLERMAASRQPS